MNKEIIDIYYEGVLLDATNTNLTKLIQGQANAYEIRIHFNPDYTVEEMLALSCLLNIERNDMEASNDIVCNPVIDDPNNLYWNYIPGKWTTGVNGILSITPKVKNFTTGVVKIYGLAQFIVAESVNVGDGTIEDEQYDAILEATSEFGTLIGANLVNTTQNTSDIAENVEDIANLREYVDIQTGNGGTDVSSAVYIEPAYVATTTNLEYIDSNDFDGELFDGLDIQDIVAEGPIRVLVKNQTIVSENGMYRMSDTGLMTKIEAESVEDIVVIIEYGNTQALKVYVCNADLSWTEVVEPGLPLQDQIDTVKGRLTVNENDIATNETNIAKNRADIDSNDIDIASNKARLTTTELATSTNTTNIATNVTNINLKEDKANKGVANGYAPLNESGVIDSAYVPNAYNDYIEVATYADLPTVGLASNLYIVKADETSGGDLSTYFWATDVYVPIHDTQSSTDIKVKYESNANTNAFTDSEKAKLLSLLTGSDYYSSSEVESRLNDLLTLGILQDTLILAENGNDYISRLETIPISYLSDYNWIYFKMTLSDDNVDHFGVFKQSEATTGALLRVNLANKIYGVLTNVDGVNAEFIVTDDANAEKVVNATCKFWGLKTTELDDSKITILTPADSSLSGEALTQQEVNNENVESLKGIKNNLLENKNGAVKYIYGTNRFNKETVSSGYLLNVDGSLIASTGWSTSDFIPVGSNTEISIVAPRYYAEYDIYKNFVLYVDTNSEDTTITTNENCAYVKYSMLTSTLNFAQLELGSTFTTRVPFTQSLPIAHPDGTTLYVDNVVNHVYEIKPSGVNLFDINTITEGYKIKSNGELISASGVASSDFIIVEQGDMTISIRSQVAEYDKYKNFINGTYNDFSVTSENTFTLNSSTKYVRFSYYTPKTNIQLESGSSATAYKEVTYSAYVNSNKVYDFDKEDDVDYSTIDHSKLSLKNVDVISNFDDDTWNDYTSTIEDDRVNNTYGWKSVKMISTNGVALEINKVVNFTTVDKVFIMKLFVEDVSTIKSLQVSLFPEVAGGYYYFNFSSGGLKTGWNYFSMPINRFVLNDIGVASIEEQVISTIYIRLVSNASVTANVTFDRFAITDSAIKRGKIILAFDDNNSGVYTCAKPSMDKYGFRGVIYTIADLVGETEFMTLDQLKVLDSNGWDIGTHGQVNLDTFATAEEIRTELLKNYDYLVDNGFYRAIGHYASPAGKYTDIAIEEIKKIFITHRTTEFRYNSLPVVNRYLLGNLGANNLDLATLQNYVDKTVEYKSMSIINWHQISETPTGEEASATIFRAMIDYIASKDVDVVTLSDIFNPLD